MIAFVNGNYVDAEDAVISIHDRGYVFADSLYEVLHIYNGKPFELEAHLKRLRNGLSFFKIPFDASSLEEVFISLISRNQIDGEGTIYLQISRGEAVREHGFPKGLKPSIVAYAKPLNLDRTNYMNGITALFYEDIRWQLCNLKTTGLFVNCLAKDYALENGVNDTIFHRGDVVTEASSSNVWMAVNNELWTHPNNNLILPGITREVVIRLAGQLGIKVLEKTFTKQALLNADEIFLSSTVNEILPVVQVEHQSIGKGKPGEITRKIQGAFEKLTREIY